jgi:hypothetical protein
MKGLENKFGKKIRGVNLGGLVGFRKVDDSKPFQGAQGYGRNHILRRMRLATV